jgi:hypothetical protein
MRGVLIATVALFVFTTLGLCSAYSLFYEHLVSLSTPAVASGKTVASAEARIGVLTGRRLGPGQAFPREPFTPYWAGDRVVKMEKKGARFVAKSRLSVTENDAGPSMGPVMVEYRLTFTDGETLTLRAQPLKVANSFTSSSREDYSSALVREQARFNGGPVPAESSCVSISLYIRGLEF